MTRDELLAARTAAWTADERAAIATVVDALRPSPHHLGDILDWLDDVAARAGTRPAAVLADATLRTALAASGSAPDRLKRWKEALRRLRYPRLIAREQEFRAAVQALELGRDVRVTPPTSFEGSALTITIRAASPQELEAILQRLENGRRAGLLAKLFEQLE